MANTYATLEPLNRILKVLSLHCMKLKGNNLVSSCPTIRATFTVTFFTVANIIFLTYKIKDTVHAKAVAATFTELVQYTFMFEYVQYIVDLYYVYKYGGDVCVEYYTRYDSIDKTIGLKNYSNIKNTITRIMIFLIIINIGSSIIDIISWVTSHFGYSNIAYTYHVEYVFFLIKTLSILDACSHIFQIECRLRAMRDLLDDKKNSIKVNEAIGDVRSYIIGDHNFNSLSKCYLLLLKQNHFINNMYGLRMLLSCLSLLCDCIDMLNLAIRVIIQTIPTPTFLPAVSSVIRLMTCAAILISLMHRCEKCYRHHEGILDNIDNILIQKNTGTIDTQENLKDFRDLITSRPIYFHANNFFRLDYAVLLSITSVVVTYTIIFLQSIKS